jgi:hypothetical protein
MNGSNRTPGLDKLEDVEFWSTINDDATITDRPFSKRKSQYRIGSEQEAKLVRQIVEDGYFESPMFIDPQETEELRRIIGNLHAHNIMPLYVTIYDEFWELLYRLRWIITPILGGNCRFLPDFWAWYIEPRDDNAGWKPHRDAQPVRGMIRTDGRPRLCTLWIPLMDVEASNSCIYVLPRKYDDELRKMIHRSRDDPDRGEIQKFPITTQNLTRVRALPVREGAIIGWDATTFHWGSGSSQWATEPRISIGIYIESQDIPLHGLPFNETGMRHIDLDDPDFRMPFETRLTVIANILDTYIYKFNKGTESDAFLSEAVRQFHNKWRRAR